MKIIKKIFLIYYLLGGLSALAENNEFDNWLLTFKNYALKNNISENTFNKTMTNVIFLPKVSKFTPLPIKIFVSLSIHENFCADWNVKKKTSLNPYNEPSKV